MARYLLIVFLALAFIPASSVQAGSGDDYYDDSVEETYDFGGSKRRGSDRYDDNPYDKKYEGYARYGEDDKDDDDSYKPLYGNEDDNRRRRNSDRTYFDRDNDEDCTVFTCQSTDAMKSRKPPPSTEELDPAMSWNNRHKRAPSAGEIIQRQLQPR